MLHKVDYNTEKPEGKPKFMLFSYFKKRTASSPSTPLVAQNSFGGFFQALKRLGRRAKLDEETKASLREMLILSDLGSTLTAEVIKTIEQNYAANQGETIETQLASVLEAILAPCNPPPLASASPCTILMVGINGAGKTTTCGKLAEKFSQAGKTVVLAAGDTFRAAAIDQLLEWGKRTQCDVIRQQPGADSASVIFDAIESATAQAADYLIADTSGRLHTQQNLMAELAKVKKVMQKKSANYPHETWLVLDASIGQNNIQQAQEFKAAVGITGLIITKLDGSGKGGSIFSIAKQLQLPIHYIGMGETAADLIPFTSHTFVQSLFD